MTPPRTRHGSRPDMRIDPDSTPPRGYAFVERGSSCDAEHRDIRHRLGAIEERVDALEDWTEGSKVTQLRREGADELWARIKKPIALVVIGVATTVVAGVLLMVVIFAMRGCPSVAAQPIPKTEGKP